MKLFVRSISLSAAFFMAGCISLLPETAPPKPRYHMMAVSGDNTSGESVEWSLVIDDPRSTRVFDTVRIAVSTMPGKIEYFAGAEWADRAPRLFQTALVQSFEDSARITAVGDRNAIPIGTFILQTDIRKIQLNVRGEPTAEVTVYTRLTDGKGKIHAAKVFEASKPADSEKGDDVIAAFNAALDDVIGRVVNWTYEAGENEGGSA